MDLEDLNTLLGMENQFFDSASKEIPSRTRAGDYRTNLEDDRKPQPQKHTTQAHNASSIKPTQEQSDIILAPLQAGKLLSIQAAAGCAKTTTATMLAYAHPDTPIIYVTFNKAAQLDAQSKMPSNVTVKTWNALALGHYRSIAGRVQQHIPNIFKFNELARKVTSESLSFQVASFGREVIKEFCNSGAATIDEEFIKTVTPSRGTLKDIAKRAAKIIDEKKQYQRIRGKLADVNDLPSVQLSGLFNTTTAQQRARIASMGKERFKAEIQAELLRKRINTLIQPTLKLTQNLWNDYVQAIDNPRSNLGIPHPIYLKKFQLDKIKLNTAVFILDEAQDTNPVCWEIFKNQNHASLVLIGDTNQAIYAWRGARNAMEKAKTDFQQEERDQRNLSASFRFGPNIAHLANIILQSIQQSELHVVGNGSPTQVAINAKQEDFTHLFNPAEPERKTTFIGRNNLDILLAAHNVVQKGATISINGGVEALRFDMIRDILELKNGADPQSLATSEIKLAKNYQELSQLCESGLFPDIQLAFTLSKIPEIRTIMKEVQEHHTTNPHKAHSHFTTAHRAKGLEWDNVSIGGNYTHWNLLLEEPNDFAPKARTLYDVYRQLQKLDQRHELTGLTQDYYTSLKEEANLLYVAVTRAKNNLTLSPDIARDIQILFTKNKEELATKGVELPYQLPHGETKVTIESLLARETETQSQEQVFDNQHLKKESQPVPSIF